MAAEDVAEIAGDGFGDAVEWNGLAEFLPHGRNRFGGEAAGDDELEVRQIDVDVEGEAVRGDGAGDVDADGGNFGWFNAWGCWRSPDAGELGDARGGDAEVGAGADEGLFHFTNEFDGAEGFALAFWGGEGAEIEDGVADKLAGTVEGDVAAAVAFNDFYAALGQEFGRGQDVGGLGVAAQGDDWGVFQQKKDVADLAGFAEVD